MFSYPALLWFLPLLGVVVLIHLINMFRHRRVEWAALEFLLAGYRRSRTRILLQQLLLLLLRTLAVAAVIFMLAGPKLEGPLAHWFGGKPTHHVILLDDSYSMNDRNTAQGGAPIFEETLAVVRQIVDGAVKRGNQDRLTLVRLSRAAAVVRGEEPDLIELPLNREGQQIVQELLANLKPSESAGLPEPLFDAALESIRQSQGRLKTVVYFLSDFRENDWENAAPILEKLDAIRKSGGQVRKVRAGDVERPNLGIEKLEIVDGIHAAGIDVLVDLSVANYGDEDAENVHLILRIDEHTQPTLTIHRLKAGETTVPPVRFPVRVDAAGRHRVEARLPSDAIPNDNRRFLVLDVPEALEVLLVAPERQIAAVGGAAQYVRVALSPTGARSGIRTRLEPPSFLIDRPLNAFGAIFLLDVPSLDSIAVKSLENYVAAGGGLAIFTGPEANLDFIRSELYRDGTGLFPFSPLAVTSLEPDFLSRTPDLTVRPHPIFRLFGEGESPLLGSVRIEQYLAVEPNESPDSKSVVLGTLRGGAPLVVEKTFGKGRTVTVLTSAGPAWNNWARGNPSFVVVMLELAAWLAKRPQDAASVLLGDPLEIRLDSTVYDKRFALKLPPEEGESEPKTLNLEAMVRDDDIAVATLSQTPRAGFYEATIREHSGTEAARFFAVNVNPREGQTRLVDVAELSALLRPTGASLESAAGFSTPFDFTGERSLTELLLVVLLLFLIAETFLAGRILPPMARR